MTYAQTLQSTAKTEFLHYRKITADGRDLEIDPRDLYDMLELDRRTDRILPHGWCLLPPANHPGFGRDSLLGSDIPCAELSSSRLLILFVVVAPGGVFVVAGAGFQAAVQDAHQSVAQLAQCSVVPGAAGPELVVVGPGAG